MPRGLNRGSIVLFVCLIATMTARSRGQAPTADKHELKVSRIALFSSGVGYFERAATVDGDSSAELKFRTDQINDILKSLVVRDFDGGRIAAVGYPSRDPIAKTLKSFGVDISGSPTLAQLLDQLRGEPVEVGGARSVKGVIVSVEKQRIIVEKNVVEVDVLNVLTDAGIQQFRVADITGIRLTNEKIDAELRKALATLASGHDADKKTVTLRFEGNGQRRVRASYLLEAPVWKTSYRLELTEKKPFLQGWATVENATEEDWKDVRLSLVSGRPISFIMDLYTPIYIPRPREELELYASLRPPEFDAGYAANKDKLAGALEERRDRAPQAPAPAFRGGAAGRRLQLKSEVAADELAKATLGLAGAGVESVASAQQAGELFEYAIKTPVSIARQHSAMLPIANDEITAEKLSIYNPASHPKYPLNGLQLTNSTPLHLMQGPVTVFDGGVYAGDAKLPDLNPNEKRLIAYALDLAVEVNVEQKSHPDELVSLRIVKGTLWHKHRYVDERNYVIKNKDSKDRTILIEQPATSDWSLIEPKEPFEKTPSLLRFKTSVPAEKTGSYKVVLERVADQTVVLTNLGLDDIIWYIRSSVISPEVKKALDNVVRLRRELDQLARERADTERQLNEATADQSRIRENLRTLRQGGDSYQRQEKKFNDVETQIEGLREQLATRRAKEEQKRGELDAYLASLDAQ